MLAAWLPPVLAVALHTLTAHCYTLSRGNECDPHLCFDQEGGEQYCSICPHPLTSGPFMRKNMKKHIVASIGNTRELHPRIVAENWLINRLIVELG